MLVTLLRIADDQFSRLLAACSRRARSFRDWYQRPSTSELRGRKLLREWLSSEQRTQYDAHNYFEVKGCHTGKRYRIRQGIVANVEELDDAGRPREGRSAHQRHRHRTRRAPHRSIPGFPARLRRRRSQHPLSVSRLPEMDATGWGRALSGSAHPRSRSTGAQERALGIPPGSSRG